MPCYEIQSFYNGEWTNDVNLLGDGLYQEANCWDTAAEAAAAMAELQQLWPDASLRVVAVNA